MEGKESKLSIYNEWVRIAIYLAVFAVILFAMTGCNLFKSNTKYYVDKQVELAKAPPHVLVELVAMPGQEIRMSGVAAFKVYQPKQNTDIKIPREKSILETTGNFVLQAAGIYYGYKGIEIAEQSAVETLRVVAGMDRAYNDHSTHNSYNDSSSDYSGNDRENNKSQDFSGDDRENDKSQDFSGDNRDNEQWTDNNSSQLLP